MLSSLHGLVSTDPDRGIEVADHGRN
jgi:hypothetical protein